MSGNFPTIFEYVMTMNMTGEIIMAASTIAAIVAIASTYMLVQAKKQRVRASELRLVRTALTEHFAAVGRLTDDPAVPDRLKLLLLTFSEAISNREVSKRFTEELASGSFKLTQSKDEYNHNPFIEDMERIRNTRQDLVLDMDKAIKSGLISIVFRWPESASIFNQVASQTLDTKKEIAAFAKISQFAAKIMSNGDGNTGFPPDGVGAHC